MSQQSDCTCTASGEHPECPGHGYEAVIRRYGDALVDVRSYVDVERLPQVSWILDRIDRAFSSPPHTGPMTGKETR